VSDQHSHEEDLVDEAHVHFEMGPAPDIDWNQIQEDLLGLVAMGGFVLTFVSPTGGNVLINRASRATDALVELAQRDRRLAAFLHRFLARARYAALLEVGAEVVIGIGVDYGVVPAASPIAKPIEAEVAETIAMVNAVREQQMQAQAQADQAEAAAAAQAAQPAPAAATPHGPAPNGVTPEPAPIAGGES